MTLHLLSPWAVAGLLLASAACSPGNAMPKAPTATPATPPPAEAELPSMPPSAIEQEVLAAMDRSVDPCEDFYRFACGGWLESVERPPDEPRYGRFHVLRDRNREALREILTREAAEPSSVLGRFFGGCMDEDAVRRAGVEPLAPLLARVDEVRDRKALMPVLAELHRAGVWPLFAFEVGRDYAQPDLMLAHVTQDGLGLPDRDYYLDESPERVEIREAYLEHLARVFTLLGHGDPEQAAARVLQLETRLARAFTPRETFRQPEHHYHRATQAVLRELAPKLAWAPYFEAIGTGPTDFLNVAPRGYFEALDDIVAEADLETLRAYLRWQLVHAYAEHLSPPFVEADFEFFARRLGGQEAQAERWKRCVQATDAALPERLGRAYVAEHFAGDSRPRALEMIREIEAAFARALAELGWMDDATRARALEKMEAVVNKIGHPERFREEAVVAQSVHAANVLEARRVAFARDVQRVGGPVDPDEWHMSAPTVNAYYSPPANEMVFPAGILQPPFFSAERPMAMNFGGIGMVMGHELTHGFDDSGRKFDARGRLRSWWEPEVIERFEARAQCVEALYEDYEVQPGVTLNGKLTLGENIADLGGIRQTHRAFERWAASEGLDPRAEVFGGLTHEQLLFVSFGQIWCTQATPEIEKLLAVVDPHAHPRFRVLGPLSNLPAFAEAFACEPGSPMRPAQTCEVW